MKTKMKTVFSSTPVAQPLKPFAAITRPSAFPAAVLVPIAATSGAGPLAPELASVRDVLCARRLTSFT